MLDSKLLHAPDISFAKRLCSEEHPAARDRR